MRDPKKTCASTRGNDGWASAMDRSPRRPTFLSPADLLLAGVLNCDDFDENGRVRVGARSLAERALRSERSGVGTPPPPPPPPTHTVSPPPLRRRRQAVPRRRAATAELAPTRRALSGRSAARFDDVATPPPPPTTPRETCTKRPGASEASIGSGSIRIEACCICLTSARTHVLTPCFHLCACGPCTTRLLQCPLCREEVVERRRVFV